MWGEGVPVVRGVVGGPSMISIFFHLVVSNSSNKYSIQVLICLTPSCHTYRHFKH